MSCKEAPFFGDMKMRSGSSGTKSFDFFILRTYHTSPDETVDFVIEKFKKLMSGHRSVFTSIEIDKLGIPGMKLEIEVQAVATE